jgi:hypothetical protein
MRLAGFRSSFRGLPLRPRANDGPVACWTRQAVVPSQQMLDQGVDSASALAAQFGIFVNRDVSRPANFLRLTERPDSVVPESFKRLTLGRRSHRRHLNNAILRSAPKIAQGYVRTTEIPPQLCDRKRLDAHETCRACL